MTMSNKYLYEQFAKDKRIYNLNQGYWKRQFKSKIEVKFSQNNILFKNMDNRGNKVYDANPIFTFINYQKTKAIRIIQDDITSENFIKDQTNIDEYLISAWTDNITLYNTSDYNEITIRELVIALFLTKETVNKTMELIAKWLREDLNDNDINIMLGKNI